MKFQRLLPMFLAASLAVAPAFVAVPAAAQSDGSDAAIGAAVGAVVSSLLFDSNRNQYYYYRDDRPVYVSHSYARRFYRDRDPGFYRAHSREFAHDGGRFSREWHEGHGGGYGGHEGYRGDHGDGHSDYGDGHGDHGDHHWQH